MTYTRGLKNVSFQYNSDTKVFSIHKTTFSIHKTDNVSIDVTELNRSEACAFSRFVFSMVQYYSHPKKKKKQK